jgi:hypothetical protein
MVGGGRVETGWRWRAPFGTLPPFTPCASSQLFDDAPNASRPGALAGTAAARPPALRPRAAAPGP